MIVSPLVLAVLTQQGLLDAREIYKKTLPSVMTIAATDADGDQVIGTGFLAIKEGVAVTAWHVVKGAVKVTVRFSDGALFESLGVIDKDERRDVALIQTRAVNRPLLEFEPNDPDVGAKCFLIGAPKGLEFSISDGIISQLRQFEGTKQLQYTCPQNPGNSGGPLLDERGRVLGIADWHPVDSQGLNFAIAATYAAALNASLSAHVWAYPTPSAPDAPEALSADPYSHASSQAFALYTAIHKQDWRALYFLAAFSPTIKQQLTGGPDKFATDVQKGIDAGGNGKVVSALFTSMANIRVGRASVIGNKATVPTSSDLTVNGQRKHFVGVAKMSKDDGIWKWDLSYTDNVEKATAEELQHLIGKPGSN